MKVVERRELESSRTCWVGTVGQKPLFVVDIKVAQKSDFCERKRGNHMFYIGI
jgi:hypothetical protein